MANKPKRRRRMGKYIRGTVDETTALTTIGANAAIKGDFDEVVIERTLISSVVAAYSLSEFTAGAGIGPIVVGIAHSDYSAAEIEEWIETTSSWSEADKVQQEISNRLIRRIGVFEVLLGDTSGLAKVLNDGKLIKTKLNWILNTGQTISLWGYNQGGTAAATTVPLLKAQGHANLWPR